MEQKVIIVSADTWKMVNEQTGDINSGCTIWYLPIDELKPIVNSASSLGVKPVKATMPIEFIDVIKPHGVPCKAVAHYVLRNSNGKQILKEDKFTFDK